MSKIEIYRIKDLETGKYLAKPKYSYNTPKLVRRGRMFTHLRYVKEVAHNSRFNIYRFLYPDLFPAYNHKIHVWNKDNTRNKEYDDAIYQEGQYLRELTQFYPDTWVVVNTQDEVLMTVNELIKDVK